MDTKIKRTSLESGLRLLAKEYEKNPSYGRELFWIVLTETSGGMGALHDIKHFAIKETLRGGHFMTYYTSSKYYGRTLVP